MSEIELIFRAVFYIAKIARLGIVIGVFEAIGKRLLWLIKPIRGEKEPTRGPTRLERPR